MLLCEPEDDCSTCDDAVCLDLVAAAAAVAPLTDFLDFDDNFDADLLGWSIDCDDSVICEG